MGVRQSLSSLVWAARSRGRIVGSGYFIHAGARVRVSSGSVLKLGRGVHVSAGASIVVKADTTLGPGVFVGRNATVVAFSPLVIGAGTLLAENVSIHTENHRGRDLARFTSAPVSIGERCWLCAGVVVTQGATIGDQTVVGANSVVTSALPHDAVVAGAPARVIRQRNDL